MTSEQVLSKHPLPVAGLLAVVSLPIHLLLPENLSQAGAATVLAMIAGVYIGFAVQDGRLHLIALEAAVAIAFTVFAAIALLHNPLLIPLGYIAHGLWDAAHHRHRVQTDLPDWYIPLCALYDVLAGLGLWLIWWLV